MTSFIYTNDMNTFVLGGGREMVDKEKIEVLLEPLKFLDSPSTLRLSNKSFSLDAARIVSNVISKFESLRVVDVSDIIAGRPEDEALQVLETISEALVGKQLIELNLSDNALGRKGVQSCRGVLGGKKLESLFLCNNGLSAEACDLVNVLLQEGGYPALVTLNFYNNMSGSGGAIAVSDIVKNCPLLRNFRFSATRSGPEGTLSLSKALATTIHLTQLDLSDNTFNKESALALAQTLQKQKHLVHLNLRDCGLGEEGSIAVLRALGNAHTQDQINETAAPPSSSPLQLLDLSANDITERSVVVLCKEALPKLPSLRDLYLDDNEVSTDGASILAAHLSVHPSLSPLRLLSLETCEVTAAGAIRLARSVAKISTFETLKLNGNAICSIGLIQVTETLSKHGKLLGDMEDNDDEGDDDVDDVEEDQDEEDQATKATEGDDDDEGGVDALAKSLQENNI